MASHFDLRQIRRAFSRAAAHYGDVADLQQKIQQQLLESLDYLSDRSPQVIIDIGTGHGQASALLQRRWPRATIIAIDLALPMLYHARKRQSAWRRFHLVSADTHALPLKDHCVDLIFSNLCLQWSDQLPTILAEFRRVLHPKGFLMCSTFGPQTLAELRQAFAASDDSPHVSRFPSIAQLGNALIEAGFQHPFLDRDLITTQHSDLIELMKKLQTMGAGNALRHRRRTLTGRQRIRLATTYYERYRLANGQLPCSWEVIYAHAWAPDPGTPVRTSSGEIAAINIDQIPIRRHPKHPSS